MTTMTEPIESTAVVLREEPQASVTLFRTDEPVAIVERATAVANALAPVIRNQHLYADIQGREHVTVEGWTLLGSMLGVFPVPVWTRPLPDGRGWEARVEARTRAGETVGGAEAMCTRDERQWQSRDDYALRSMAQTRATSKALRLPLGFVMVLSGFDASPAEEVPTEQPRSESPQSRQEARQAAQPPKVASDTTGTACPVHGTAKVRDGQYGPYCATKLADGSWCKAMKS